jgi:hypothetical protein
MRVDVPTDSDPVVSSALLTMESGEDGFEGSPSKNMMGGSLSASEEEGDVDETLMEAAGETPSGLSALTADGVVPRCRRTRLVPTAPTRMSKRLLGPASATSVLQRAQERAASKNLEGNLPVVTPLPPIASFLVLTSLTDSHLEEVTHDSGVAFTLEKGSVSDTLSLIRAKEEAQAALALAAFRQEQDAVRAAVEVPPAVVDADGPASATTMATVSGNSSREELPTVTPGPTKRGACTISVTAHRGRRKLTRT